jgi:hypothetical protein
MTGNALIEAFESGELDPEVFDHEHHLALAWAYLRNHPLPEAMILMRDGLKRFTALHGAEGKYHETLTFALVAIIAERMATHESSDWPRFLAKNSDLITQWRTLLGRYYSSQRLDSPQARQAFLWPDRPEPLSAGCPVP